MTSYLLTSYISLPPFCYSSISIARNLELHYPVQSIICEAVTVALDNDTSGSHDAIEGMFQIGLYDQTLLAFTPMQRIRPFLQIALFKMISAVREVLHLDGFGPVDTNKRSRASWGAKAIVGYAVKRFDMAVLRVRANHGQPALIHHPSLSYPILVDVRSGLVARTAQRGLEERSERTE